MFEEKRLGNPREPRCYMCLKETGNLGVAGAMSADTLILGDGGGGITNLHPELLRQETEAGFAGLVAGARGVVANNPNDFLHVAMEPEAGYAAMHQCRPSATWQRT